MKDILAWLSANAHPASFVAVTADRGSVGFYERLGFVARDLDEPAMTHPNWGRTATVPV